MSNETWNESVTQKYEGNKKCVLRGKYLEQLTRKLQVLLEYRKNSNKDL